MIETNKEKPIKEKPIKIKRKPPFDIIDGDATEVLTLLNSYDLEYNVKIHKSTFDLKTFQWVLLIEKRARLKPVLKPGRLEYSPGFVPGFSRPTLFASEGPSIILKEVKDESKNGKDQT